MHSSINPFLSAQAQMQSAYSFLGDAYTNQFSSLLQPHRVIEVSIPVHMDDGSIRVFTGYRSQHNNARGPYKGGIRFHPDVSREEVMALSIWMSIKCATLDLPLGGGKGGVIFDPKELSLGELERLSRGYVDQLFRYLGPDQDVPAPDVNTNAQIMSWMVDEYSRVTGSWAPGTFTGKPVMIGGSLGRDTATAQGGYYVLEGYLESIGQVIAGKKIIIQGAGNAGLEIAKLLVDGGAIVVGISDSHGGIYLESGLDISLVRHIKQQKQSVITYPNAQIIESDVFLLQSCDILIPAALENQIFKENASDIQAKLIMELANGPITPEADAILHDRGIMVIPDILANAGGVTVSYFEQVQNSMNFSWDRDKVQHKLQEKMKIALQGVQASAYEHHVPLRIGAYIIALKRILEAMKLRGM